MIDGQADGIRNHIKVLPRQVKDGELSRVDAISVLSAYLNALGSSANEVMDTADEVLEEIYGRN